MGILRTFINFARMQRCLPEIANNQTQSFVMMTTAIQSRASYDPAKAENQGKIKAEEMVMRIPECSCRKV